MPGAGIQRSSRGSKPATAVVRVDSREIGRLMLLCALQRDASVHPQGFSKTIIVNYTLNGRVGPGCFLTKAGQKHTGSGYLVRQIPNTWWNLE